MWDQIENTAFLTLFFGVPVILVLTFGTLAVRAVLSRGRPSLAQAAKQRGWSDTTGPGLRFRFTGSIDGTPFVYEAPELRANRGGTRAQVRIPFEAESGAFVVQHEIPELVRKLVGSLGGAMLDVVGRDDMASALRALEKLDAKGHGPYVAYATPDAHRDAPHTEALGRVLVDLDARASGGVVLYTWAGELVLLARGEAFETPELVDVAVRCHRVLESDPGSPTSYR